MELGKMKVISALDSGDMTPPGRGWRVDNEEAEANFLRSLAMKDEGRAEQTDQRQIFGS